MSRKTPISLNAVDLVNKSKPFGAFFLSDSMRILFTILALSLTSLVKGQSDTLTTDDKQFVENVVKDMKPLRYTATATHHGVVLVMVFKDYTLIETLVDGYVEDLIELTKDGVYTYPRESE